MTNHRNAMPISSAHCWRGAPRLYKTKPRNKLQPSDHQMRPWHLLSRKNKSPLLSREYTASGMAQLQQSSCFPKEQLCVPHHLLPIFQRRVIPLWLPVVSHSPGAQHNRGGFCVLPLLQPQQEGVAFSPRIGCLKCAVWTLHFFL